TVHVCSIQLQYSLTLSIRRLLMWRVYTAFNIVGLATGMAAVIVILLFAHHDLTYDRFHEHADDLYLVYKERVTPTGTQVTRDTRVPLADRLEQESPSVEEAVRLWTTDERSRVGDRRRQGRRPCGDAPLPRASSLELAKGDAAALDDVSWVVLSETTAKYFGDRDPIGEPLRLENGADYVVRGVLEEIPANSSIEIDLAVPLASARFYADVVDEWGGSFIFTYALLRAGTDPAALEAQFPELVRNIWDEEVASRTNVLLEPLSELYNADTGN